jgi:hypothetical protein
MEKSNFWGFGFGGLAIWAGRFPKNRPGFFLLFFYLVFDFEPAFLIL